MTNEAAALVEQISAYGPSGLELWRIVTLLGFILVPMLAGKVAQLVLRRSADSLDRRERVAGAATLRAIAKGIIFVLFAFGLQQGLKFVVVNPSVAEWVNTAASVLVTIAIGYLIYGMVDVVEVVLGRHADKTPSKMDDMLVPIVRKSLRITVAVLTLVQVAQLLSDKPITSILAGLGIGGLAVALAAQDTLKNVFGSLVIFGDKPFELGDRIVIDGHDGPVEAVGFRSTKIRTLEGHLVTVPNGELANKTIHNIGKRPNIRRILNIAVTYDTPPEKVQEGIEIVRDILADHEGMDPELPPRVHFNEFKDCSLNIFAIYWYHPPDWWPYLEFSEKVNFEILRRFNEAGIEFAFPTQTVHVEGVGGSGSG